MKKPTQQNDCGVQDVTNLFSVGCPIFSSHVVSLFGSYVCETEQHREQKDRLFQGVTSNGTKVPEALSEETTAGPLAEGKKHAPFTSF